MTNIVAYADVSSRDRLVPFGEQVCLKEVDEIVERETVKKGADASWEFDVFFKNGERRTVTAVGTPAGYRIDWVRYEIAAGGGLSDESASSLADAGDSAG